jgi:D-alanine-D-alanine ligase
MGGKSAEREVSLSTGKQVLAALDSERYDAFSVDPAYLNVPSAGDPPLVGRNRPDVAVICLHGRFGEDGTIQGMLELMEIPYTGSGVLASALAIDKVMSKKILALEGIPVPPGLTLRGKSGADDYLARFRAGTAEVMYPSVVKPSRQGSTIGISVVDDPSEMAAALDTALHYDEEILVEKFIDGIEITGPVLGNDDVRPLPLVEIVPSSGFYDYEAKYTPGATDEIVPARLSPEQTRQAQELAVRSHKALTCRGFSRTDMLVAADAIYVLEVNTIPGMTPTSLLPRSAEAAGLSFAQLVDRMVQLALEGRSVESTPTPTA